ncbi:hypothetical protein [Vibrio fluvialis]|uniref:hypothetical protein n=1 Tax=Vibrio fluvialis TaxID=676 RepID=UPI001F4104D4|nr:hypothetical protein [Vibrio fluvialis]MCE7596358.1 hypothetical protein [Vibrio fluvialis]
MSKGELAVLLDCDNSKMSMEMPTLLSRRDVAVIAVSNDINKLPKALGKAIGEVVDAYDNSADFRMIAQLAAALESRPISDVIIVTQDRPFARAVQEFSNLRRVNCEHYQNIYHALYNDRLLQALLYDPLNW